MAKKKGIVVDQDELAASLAEELGKIGVPVYKLGDEETPTDLRDWVSTGSSLLDLAISNRSHGGIPMGRIIELNGLEGSGKSLVCAHLLANVQKLGGIGVLIDAENATSEDYFSAVGVDMSKLIYLNENCLETVFESIEKIIEKVRQSLNRDKQVIIVVDSLAQLATAAELESGFAKEGYGTDKAYLISKAMRKLTKLIGMQKILLVFTNQLRMNLQPMSHEKWITPGGKALPFAASLRIRLSQLGKIKKGDDIVGVKVQAKIIKNRFGPPHREANFDIYFDRGIDDLSSWLDYMKKHEIVLGGAGGNYEYVDLNGEPHKFKSGAFKTWTEENPEMFKEMYQRICDTMIMSYRSDNISTADGSATVEESVGDDD